MGCQYEITNPIVGMIIAKEPSRYMVKKYGYQEAWTRTVKRDLKNGNAQAVKFDK